MTAKFKEFFHSIWLVIKDTLTQMRDGEIRLVASSLSYSTVLSIIPFIAVILATFKAVGGLETVYPKVESFILQNLTTGSGDMATRFFKRAIDKIHAGSVGTFGIAMLVVVSLRLLSDMELGVQRVWNLRKRRPFLTRVFTYGIILLVFPVLLAVYVGFISFERGVIGVQTLPVSVINACGVMCFLFVVYKFVPNTTVHWKPALVSTIFVSIGIGLAKVFFTFIGKSFFNYSKIYGSLAALPIFFIWVTTIWYLILGGVALTASLQNRRILEKLKIQKINLRA